MELRQIMIGVSLLGVALIFRFIAISHQLTFDFASYAAVLDAYFKTSTRAIVFGVQFAAIVYGLVILTLSKFPEWKPIALATILFTVVSTARYFYPIYVVSVWGDLAVLFALLFTPSSRHSAMIALGLFIVTVLLMMPEPLLWQLLSVLR